MSLIIVEGSQGAGKTHLIENSKYSKYHYKFSFPKFAKELAMLKNNEAAIFAFTMGKDLQLLEYASRHTDQIIITDRNFLSTAAYGMLFHRTSDQNIYNFLTVVEELWNTKNNNVIYVEGVNALFQRKHNDEFDYIFAQRDKQIECYKKVINHTNIPIAMFFNHYTEESQDEFDKMLTRVIFE